MKKRLKRLLSIILSLVMCMTCLPAEVQVAYAESGELSGIWTDSRSKVTPVLEDGKPVYKISTAAQLAWVAAIVNDDIEEMDEDEWAFTQTDATFRLVADIDLSAHYWIPIGKDYNHAFTAAFDGNGHTITGMRVGSESAPYTDGFSGLFGSVSGSLVNIKLTDSYVYSARKDDTDYMLYSGVLAGQLNGSAANCEADGAAYTEGSNSVSNCALGGIAGTLGRGTVVDACRVNVTFGALDPEQKCSFGGIAGAAANLSSATSTFRNCVAVVKVLLPEGMSAANTYSDAIFATGKSGAAYNCIGIIDHGKAVASLRSTGTRTNVCFVETNYNRKVNDSYELQEAAYTYYDGDGSASGKTAEEMQADMFIETLNTAADGIDGALTWSLDAGINSGFPNLADAKQGEGNGEAGATYYTVTYMSNGAAYKTQSVESGSTASRPQTPDADDGYTFLYWYADDEETAYDFTAPVTGDLILTAKWKQAEYVSVTFMSEEKVYHTIAVESGGTVAEPEAPAAAEGYTFLYWYADDADAAYDFSTPVAENLTLTAKWKGEEYNVRFDSMGGSYVYPQAVMRGEKAESPAIPAKKGYSFGGWYADSTYTNAWDFDTPVTGSMTLYAKWNDALNVSVSGRITDSKSGLGIRNASVTLSGGQNAATDEFGYYRISDVSQGSYIITVTANGYNSASEEGFEVGDVSAGYDAALTMKSGAGSSTVNVYATISCVYSGIMLDGVQVKAVGEGSLGTYTETTADGGLAYFTGLPAGKYTFYVNQTGRAGWESYTSSEKTLSGDYQLNCALKPQYQTLKVNVLGGYDPVSDQKNMPLAGKTVKLTGVDPKDEDNELISINAYTDAKGSVTVEKLVPITWKVSCSDFAYEETEAMVYSDGSGQFSEDEVTLTLPFVDSSVSVELSSVYNDPELFKKTDENKDSLPDVSLTGIVGTMTEGIYRSAKPDESGKIEFKGLFPGNYNVNVSGKIERYVDILSGDQKEIFDQTDNVAEQDFSRFGRKHFAADIQGMGTASVALGARADATVEVTPTPVNFSGTLFKKDMDENGEITTSVCANTKIIVKPSDYYKQSGDNANGYEITTDAQGRYSVTLAPGLYGVEVESRYSDYFGGHLVYREGHPNGYKGTWGWPCTGKWAGSKASAVAWMTSDESLAYGDIGGMGLSSGTVIADLEMVEKKVSYKMSSPGYDIESSYYLITGYESAEEKTVVDNDSVWNDLDYYENTYNTINFHPETRGAKVTMTGDAEEEIDMTGKSFPAVINGIEPGSYSFSYKLSDAFSHLETSYYGATEISFYDFPAPGKLPASFPEDYAKNENPWPLASVHCAPRIDPKSGSNTIRDLYDGDNSNGELTFKFYYAKTYANPYPGGASESEYAALINRYGSVSDIDLHWRFDDGTIGTKADGVYKDPPKEEDYDNPEEYQAAYKAWDDAEYTGKGFPKDGGWLCVLDGPDYIHGTGLDYTGSPHWSESYGNSTYILQNYLVAYSTSKTGDKLFYVDGDVVQRVKAIPDGDVTLYFCAPKGKGYSFVPQLSFIRNRETNYTDLYNSNLWFSVKLNKNSLTECLVNFIEPGESSDNVTILSETQINNLLNPRTIKVQPVESSNMENALDNVDVEISIAGNKYSSKNNYPEQTVTGTPTDPVVAEDEYEWKYDNLSSITVGYDEKTKTETYYIPMKRKTYSYELSVMDSDGNAVQGASIRLDPSTNGDPVYVTSSSDGSAMVNEYPGLTYQNYTVNVSADGYASAGVTVTKDHIKDGTKKTITLSKAEQPTFTDDSVTIDRKGAFIPGVNYKGSSNTVEFLTNLGSGDLYYTVTAQVDTAGGDSIRDIFIADKKAFKNPDCSDIPETLALPATEGAAYNPSKTLEWVEKLKSGALGTVYYRPLYDEEGFTYESVLNDGGYHYEFSRTIPLWELPPDGFEPCIVAVTAMGAVQIYSMDYSGDASGDQLIGIRLEGDYAVMLNNITLMANAKAVGGGAVEKLAELTEPTGSIIPLPSFESGIELDDDGFLSYSYTIEMQLLQGKKSVSDAEKAYMAILPSTLGVVVSGGWNMGLDGKECELSNSYDVSVAGDDMDALDYLPSAFKALPVKIGFDEDNPPTGKFTLTTTDTRDKNNHNVKEAYSFGANGQVHINAEVSAFSSFGAVLPVGPVLASLEKSGALDIGAQVKVAVGADGTYTYTIENGSETSHEVTFTIGAGAGIGMYAKAFGGAVGAEANLKLSGDNDRLEDMVTVSATVDRDGFRLNTLDGKVMADAHIEIDTWFINGEKDFTFAEIPFSYQFGTVTQFNLTPITVTDTIKTRNDFEASVFNGKPETVVSNLLPIGGYATDEADGAAFIYTDMSAKGGNVRLMLSEFAGGRAWKNPVSITESDGLIPAFDVISLGGGKYLAVWTEIDRADMEKTCPPSTIKYSVGTVSAAAWSGEVKTVETLSFEVASKLLLVSSGEGVSLVALKTAEGALAGKLDIAGYQFDGSKFGDAALLADDQPLYDIQAAAADETVFVTYVTEDKKLHALSWNSGIVETKLDAAGFETALAGDGSDLYMLCEEENGLSLYKWDGGWKRQVLVTDMASPGNPALIVSDGRVYAGWTADNETGLYTAVCEGASVSEAKEMKKTTTGHFEDVSVFAADGQVGTLAILSGETDSLNTYNTGFKAAPAVTAPTTKTGLVENGKAQVLIGEGSAVGGTMYYAVTNSESIQPTDEMYSVELPTGTEAGTYYVWYKAVGDNTHFDTQADLVAVTIAGASQTDTGVSVAFDANGGTGTMEPQTVTKGEAAVLKANTYTRTGYTFAGWAEAKNAAAVKYADRAQVTFNADITLYAVWTADSQGGNGGQTPTTEAPATTEAPKTEAPATTEAPKTEAPTTEAPTTEAPTTEAPRTEAPRTEAPRTEAPRTEAPTTEAPKTETPAITGTTVTDTTSNAEYVVTSEAGTEPEVEYKGTESTGEAAVTIPDAVTVDGVTYKVTSVAAEAFKDDTTITTVTIGSNVETIEENAFAGCTQLTSVTIPESVTTISEGAFSGCTKLASVAIPESVTTIEQSAFSGCTKLKTATIGTGVTEIGAKAFSGCTSLAKVTIPASVTTIGDQAFSGDKKLKTATLGKSVTEIGTKAFANCTSLTKINIPAKVTKIGSQAFAGDKKLKTITIKSTKLTSKSISRNAFKGITEKTTIKVPKSKKKEYTILFRKKGLSKKVKIK